MNEGRGTLKSLSTANDAIGRLLSDLDTIEDLCHRCFEVLTCKGDINRLGDVHANLRAVLLHADTISSLPAKAADAERRLNYSGAETLVEVYISLAELEATVSQVEVALEGIPLSATAQQQVANLDFYFNQVRRAMGQMEEHIWSILRGYYRVARQNPSLLVAALQIIEIQEEIDRQLMAGQVSKSRKGWRRRCFQQLEASVMEIFAPVLREASKLVDENNPPSVLLPTVLRECTELVADLRTVKEHVGPCFPPSYNATEVICKEYHTQLESLFQLLGLCARNLSNADVLLVLGWVDSYYSTLRNLGLDALNTLTFSGELIP
jgi:exocyst complex component 3